MNYYDILKVGKDASTKEIKRAFRELSKTHHPDKGGDAETFKILQKAYETLSDEERRAHYDAGGNPESFKTLQQKATAAMDNFINESINSFGFVPDHTDLVSVIRGKIQESIKLSKESLEAMEFSRRNSNVILKRVKSGEAIRNFVEKQLKILEHTEKQEIKRMELLETCLNLTEGWEYEYEEDRDADEDIRRATRTAFKS